MDNHDSHISKGIVEAAIENDVVLVGLPSHTTHILQPLDVHVIGPLKVFCQYISLHIIHRFFHEQNIPIILSIIKYVFLRICLHFQEKLSTLAVNVGFSNQQCVIGKSKFPILLSHAIDQVNFTRFFAM
jgi:hypothetical protein